MCMLIEMGEGGGGFEEGEGWWWRLRLRGYHYGLCSGSECSVKLICAAVQ